MNTEQKTQAGLVRGQVEAIVAEGNEVRQQVSEVVAEAAERFHLYPEGLIELAQAVMDGAFEAVRKSVPTEPESTLRQVIDGLGDGFSTAALAGKLAIEEAASRGKAFATEDLARMTRNLTALADRFVKTVSATGGAFSSITQQQLDGLRQHVVTTHARIRPSLESAAAAAAQQPLQFARESVGAGAALARQGLGALFTAAGRSIYVAGKQLAGERRSVNP
ncbi:MAG: DUF6781 family protein [Deltaproteobacteria bacterium]